MSVEQDLQRLIPSIYDLATPTSVVFGDLQRLLHARACAVAVFNFDHREGMFDPSSGYRAPFLNSYRDHFAPYDPWLGDDHPYREPGTVHLGQELVGDSELMATRFYQEWLEPQGLFQRLSTVLVREAAELHYFVAWRARGDEPFGPDEVRMCRVLAPHLRSAVQMRRQLALLQVERNAALEILDRLPTAVVLCDQNGTPIILNSAAKEILAHSDALVIRGGRLSARRPPETRALESLIAGAASAARGDGDRSGGTLALTRASGARPLSVLVSPMRAPNALPGYSGIAVALFISDPEAVVVANEERLLQLYGLTRAESRLAARIAEGRSLEEAAATLNITTQTARSYIKRVLGKTGTKRQVELVRLLLLSPAHLS